MAQRLERDVETAILGGVVAGMAKYFRQDPVLFRVLAIAFIILTGIFPGLLIYILAWIITPKERHTADYEVVE
ncbi:MAG: PspC domain-containing protein [Patescibacteria group bacterium]